MLGYRLGTASGGHWRFKPAISNITFPQHLLDKNSHTCTFLQSLRCDCSFLENENVTYINMPQNKVLLP